jgi:adenylate cyclase
MSRRRRIREDIQDSTLARLPKEIEPPTGSLAMVFTDIRESTVLWETQTAPMRVAKKMHHMIMRRSLRNIGGYEVKTEGDAFMVTFPDAAKAVRWCLEVQKELLEADWPPELLRSPICQGQLSPETGQLLYKGISVRMGIHYGEMECEQDIVTGRMDYNGIPVIIASRIQSQALGGQILVSSQCKQEFDRLLQDNNDDAKLAERTLKPSFIDVGWLRLKGIEAREHVYALYPETLIERFTGPPDGAISNETAAALEASTTTNNTTANPNSNI